MYKRREIRESAVQFLYFSELAEGESPSDSPDPEIQETFWTIIQESSLHRLSHAKIKALLHIVQGRNSRIARLSKSIPQALSDMKTSGGSHTTLTVPLRKVLRQESKLSAALELLKSSIQSKTSEELMEPRLNDVYIANRVLKEARVELMDALLDSPTWKAKLTSIASDVEQLDRISERLSSLEHFEKLPNAPRGMEHLYSTSHEISSFRKDTEDLIQGVLSNINTIDETLNEKIENFTPERVNPVDRAILRIGAYEIIHCDDIPAPVSINEAIEIAKRFSTTDSSRFINGILDSIQRTA